MAEENLDLEQRAEFNRAGTTNLESFLPFGGENLSQDSMPIAKSPEPTPVSIDSSSRTKGTSTLPQYPVKDTVVGFDPFSKNQIANSPGSVGEGLAKKLQKELSTLDSHEHYSKTYMYDASATGAHKARYKAYGQKTYDKIGFNPEINNEDIFNENTSIVDDYVRMATNSAFPMFFQGLWANPKSYAQIFQGNIGQDLDASEQYEEWNAIGYSSKGGLGGFFNNAINSVSYSAGIMFESVAEYALIGAIEGGIAGTAVGPEGTVAGGAAGGILGGAVGAIKGLAAVPKALFSMGKYGGKMLTNLKNLEKFTEAKALFNAASKTTFEFVNPVNNTFAGYKAAKADNLTNLARTAKTAGGFFRDVIGMNMALSEGRLEGGFVENNTYQKAYDEYWKRNNKAPDIDTQVRMKKTAKLAGAQDTFKNAALVFYSNKLAFKNLVEGKFMAGSSGTVRSVGKEFDVIYQAAKEKGAQGVYELVDYNLKNAAKGIIKPRNFGKATLNYFKTNVVEGGQEVLQDVIAKSTEDYYVNSFYDPSKANFDYSMATLGNAFGHQVSAEGFETFMSGFVMGGLLKPFGGAVPRYAGVLYNKYTMNPAEYEEYIQQREGYGKAVVAAMNNMNTNPTEFFKERFVNLGVQSKVNTTLADEEASKKEKHDAIETSFLSDVLTTLNAGTFKTWLYNFKKTTEMGDTDLEQTFNLKEGDGAKIRETILEYVDKAKGLQERFNYAQETLGDKKLKLQNFKEGTPEYEKAAIYNKAIDTGIFNLVFLTENFQTNLERSNKIVQKMARSKVFASLPGGDVQNLLEHDRLVNTIEMLNQEIEALKNTEDPKALREVAKKEELLKKLTKFQETQLDWFQTVNTTEKLEAFNKKIRQEQTEEDEEQIKIFEEWFNEIKESGKDPINNHKEAFIDLLKYLAGSEVNFASAMRTIDRKGSAEDSLFEDLTDIYKLTLENKNIIPYVNLLNNRAGFYEHVERNFQWMRNMWLNRQNYYKEIVDQSIKMKENNAALKALADDNIYVDLDQFADWTEDKNNLPEYFIDASKGAERIIPKGSYLYDQYVEILERVARMQEFAAGGDPVDLNGQLEEATANLMSQKSNELEAAEVSFKSSIAKETGFTYDQLQEQAEASEARKTAKDKTANDLKIKSIQDFIKSLDIADPNEITDRIQKYLKNSGLPATVLNEDLIQETVDEIAKDQDLIKREVLPILQKFPNSYTDESKAIAAMRTLAIQRILNDEINNLSIEEDEIIAEDYIDPITTTQSWKDYQKEIAEIEAKYEKLLAELVEEFSKRGASTATVDEEEAVVSTATPWSEIETKHPKLFKILSDKFRKEVIEDMGISEGDNNFDQIRNNWLETQAEVINNYNAEQAAQKAVQQQKEKEFKQPNLKYYKLPKALTITPASKIKPLLMIRDGLQSMLDTGVRINSKGNEVKLKPAELEKIKNDISELNRITGWLRQYGAREDVQVYQKHIDIFNERVRNRKVEVEEVRDENGRLIERRLNGQPTRRVTKEAEALSMELVPGKKPFMYYGLDVSTEDILDAEGNVIETVEKPSEILTQYDAIVEDDTIADENKVDTFITSFVQFVNRYGKNVFKNARNTGLNEEKFRLLRESLENDFSKENVIKTIQELAYKHNSDVGIMLDDLIKDFLTFEGTEFKRITKPEKMSKEAFDALFSTTPGKEGIITRFRDGVIDGEYVVVGASDLLFDKSVFENGLVGETDLIAINKNGDFEIIDVKALGASSWKTFNADIQLENKIQELKNEGLSDEDIEKSNEIKKLRKSVTFSRKPYFEIQQSLYANLFYNMTGIMPKRISLLGIEVDIDNEGYLKSAKLSPILKQEFELTEEELAESTIRTLPLTYNEASQRIVPLRKPTEFTSETTTDAKADIERRYKEEIKIALNKEINDSFTPVKVGPKNEARSAEEAILNTTNFLKETFNWPQVEISINSEQNSFTFIVNGTEFKVGGSIGFSSRDGVTTASLPFRLKDIVNEKYQAELAALEEDLGVMNDQLLDLYAEENPTDPYVQSYIGKKVVLGGKVGVLELRGDTYTVNFGNYIQDLEYEQEPLKEGFVSFGEVGLTLIKRIERVGQVRYINGKSIDAKILSSNNAIINNVNYRLNRNQSGQIVSMTYNVNDQEIAELENEKAFYESEIDNLNSEPTPDETAQNNKIRAIANYRIEITKLNQQLNSLRQNNPQRTMRGGNLNDYIFALNSLPESFKLLKGKNANDEKKDLKEIERLSTNPGVAIQIDEIFNKNYPDALDKLLEEGVSKISEDELSNIYKWSNEVILDLTLLGSKLAISNRLTNDVDNQINAMYELLNDLELIKLTKNGKIDRRATKRADQAFGPKKVQDRIGLSENEKSISGQTKGVSRKQARKEPTIEELQAAAKAAMLTEESILSGLSTEENIEQTKEADKLIENIEKAKDIKALDKAYLKAIEYLQNNPTKISASEINSANLTRRDELNVKVEETSLQEGDYLMPKTPIFGNENVSPVLYIKKNKKDGTVTIEDVATGQKQDLTVDELDNFVKMTKEGIAELNNLVQLTEEEKQEFNENLQKATEVLKDAAALGEVASKVETGGQTGSFLENLKRKKCNI